MCSDYFNESAPTWDNESGRVMLARAVGETIVREVKPSRDMDVLDYGCGTGLLSLFLLLHVRSITGADSSPGMLDVLRGKIAAAGIGGLRLIQLDLEQDPVPAERFHMVVVSMAMHHVAKVERVLQAFWKLLLPGGVVCVADLDTEPGTFHKPEAEACVHHHGFDREALKEQLRAAGFGPARDTTVVTFTKSPAGGSEGQFSVFLVWATR